MASEIGRNIDWDNIDPSVADYLVSQGFRRGQTPNAASQADLSILGVLERIPKKPHKYHAEPTWYNGRKYPSKAQAKYAWKLDTMKEAGEIIGYLEEVWFPLGPDFSTRLDFVVALCNAYGWYLQAHEVKGQETPQFKKVRKLWPKYAWMPLHIIKGGNAEIIQGA